MTRESQGDADKTRDAVLSRVRALVATVRERAAAAEAARTVSRDVVDALLAAGITRILVPLRFGGYGLGLDTWFDVAREIGQADASHAWCASLMIHHAHLLGQFPEAAQQAVWANGVDVPVAASVQPLGRVTRTDGGYRISGEFPFASGINHSRWIIVGSMLDGEARFFLIGPNDFGIKDTWFTTAMCATGSNTAICIDAYVPESHVLALADAREGKTPGGRLHDHPIYRAPWISYAPLTFMGPMLGAA
jgi:3-hydroxy-9,10-secoandrosta-1,3,5(10)-triene-9,17-dione monooxygenase